MELPVSGGEGGGALSLVEIQRSSWFSLKWEDLK